ncbi:MAG: polyprenyl synthetase family protein [Dehalococcoidales bacterium]|nr:polyprenyl synthetase family protein [Dehalococcoidales bacterium]
MSLSTIYEPIQKDLVRVEEGLSAVGDVSSPWLSRLLTHSLKAGGKRIRPAMVLLAGKVGNYDLGHLLPMAVAIEVLHTATLVHDDVIDSSPVRRGHPTINEVWGKEKAIILGDYMLAKAEALVAETRSQPAISLFAQTLMTISGGELDQSFNIFNLEQTREQYLPRIAAKTASLLVLAAKSGAILSQSSEGIVEALGEYANNLGIAFQIVDDILNFVGNEAEMGKPTGSDLAEGTLTLPGILLLERYPDDNPIRRLFGGEGNKQENIKQAIELVGNSSIIEECYQVAADYYARACRSLEWLPEGVPRRSFKELAEYVIARRK